MSKRQSLEKILNIIDEHSESDVHMFYKNSFAICCYLISLGEVKAGKKQLSYLFDVLGRNKNKTYFASIYDSIEDFSAEYASEIRANLEINKLFISHKGSLQTDP